MVGRDASIIGTGPRGAGAGLGLCCRGLGFFCFGCRLVRISPSGIGFRPRRVRPRPSFGRLRHRPCRRIGVGFGLILGSPKILTLGSGYAGGALLDFRDLVLCVKRQAASRASSQHPLAELDGTSSGFSSSLLPLSHPVEFELPEDRPNGAGVPSSTLRCRRHPFLVQPVCDLPKRGALAVHLADEFLRLVAEVNRRSAYPNAAILGLRHSPADAGSCFRRQGTAPRMAVSGGAMGVDGWPRTRCGNGIAKG